MGATIGQALRFGIARGLFSNEAGLGSATFAHGTAKVDHPTKQGLAGIVDVFIDTIVVCTITGLSIVATGVYASHQQLTGAQLAQEAFAQAWGHVGPIMIAICIVLFAFSTILGWSYYGRQSLLHIVRTVVSEKKFARVYRATCLIYNTIFVVVVFLGSIFALEIVWSFSDLANGLMAITSLIGVLGMAKVVKRLSNEGFREKGPK